MIFLLGIVVAILLVTGLFYLLFFGRFISWATEKLAGPGQAKQTTASLSSPVGRTLLWRQKAKGVFFILIACYAAIALAAPALARYFPTYVLFIPFMVMVILSVIMVHFSFRRRKSSPK
jgi:hypothetical protein